MQSELGIRLTANTDSLRQGVQNAKFLMDDLGNSAKLASEGVTPPMADSIGAGGQSSAASSIFLSKDQYKELIVAINNVTQVLRDKGTSEAASSKAREQDRDRSNEKLFKELSQTAAIAMGVYTGYEQYQTTQIRKRMRQMAGDPYGAMQEELQGNANVQKTMWGTIGNVAGIGVGALFGPVAGLAIGSLINSISSGVINAQTERKIAEIQERQQKVDKYRERVDLMDESYRKYGGANMWETQAAMLSASQGVGMGINEFMGLANKFSAYGVTTSGRASDLARAAGLAARYTGADSGSLAAYLGTQERYGGNALSDMNYAYNAALASGLQRNQFGEFLDGLENVIETGISKGYVRSTKEVSDTMVMFDKLSGGSKFWQGEQGFNRLQTINNGLANATALNSSTQLAVYQAMAGLSGGDMLDTFALMEKGLDVNSFKAISQRFKNIFGGDRYSEVMAWKELSGLNYTGAMQLRDMAQGDFGNVTQKMIDDVYKGTQSDQTRMKDALNKIETQVTKWGSDYFPEYLEMLKSIAGETAPTTSEGYKKNVEGISFVAESDTYDYFEKYLKENYSPNELKELRSSTSFNRGYDEILTEAQNKIWTESYDNYRLYGDKYKGEAAEEALRNQETLRRLVDNLENLIKAEREKSSQPQIYQMPAGNRK